MAAAATVVRSLSLDSLTTGVLTIAIFIGLIKAVRDAQGALKIDFRRGVFVNFRKAKDQAITLERYHCLPTVD